MRLRRLGQLATLLTLPLIAAAASLAFFSAGGTGTAQATVAAIVGPSSVTAVQNGSVSISWSAATLSTGGAVQGYRVTRSDGAGVCGTPTLTTNLQCADANVSAGTFSYTVTAVYNTWAATATSSPITALTAPTLTSKPTSPSANVSPTIAFSDGGTAVGYQCSLDAGAFTACTNPQSLQTLNGNSNLGDGSHTIKVHAIQGTSTGPDTSYTWTVNSTAPALGSTPPATSASSRPSFSFSDSTYATLMCQLDGAGYRACTSPKAYTGLADGSHTFQVEAIDADGVATRAATYTWTTNTAAPTITAQPANPSLSPSASFSFSHTAYTGFKCQLDGAGYSACASPASYTALAGGSHTFQVEAIDSSGAATSASSYTWKTGVFWRAGSTAQTTANATSLTLADPSGTVAGDVMVALIATTDAAHVPASPGSGWTRIRGFTAAFGAYAAYWHIATSSEPASYSFTNVSSTLLAGGIDVYGGESTRTPVQTSAQNSGGPQSNPVAPSITTTAANERVIVATGYGPGGNPDTVPSGTTGRGSATAVKGASSVTVDSADFNQTSAAATPTKTFTLSSTAVMWATVTIGLSPA